MPTTASTEAMLPEAFAHVLLVPPRMIALEGGEQIVTGALATPAAGIAAGPSAAAPHDCNAELRLINGSIVSEVVPPAIGWNARRATQTGPVGLAGLVCESAMDTLLPLLASDALVAVGVAENCGLPQELAETNCSLVLSKGTVIR